MIMVKKVPESISLSGLAFVPDCSLWYERIAKRITKVWNGTGMNFSL